MKIRKRIQESGQALVEFALILPILLLLLCGIIDFGWIFSNQLMVDFSARDGARFGAVNASSTTLSTIVTNHVKANALVSVPASLLVTTNKLSSDVSVKVDYSFPLMTPVISTVLNKTTFTVSSTCIMKAE